MEKNKRLPLIDIIVPTYNRPNDIIRFVEEIQKQDYPFFNVIIIDDCSPTKIEHLIPDDNIFKYIRLKKNEGQAAARNCGIKHGKGDIIVSMDDDAWFYNDRRAIVKIVEYFERDKNIGCLMFDILEPNKDWLSVKRNCKDFEEIGSHITCGCAYTRNVLEKIDGFNALFHSYAEETDITLRIINKGFKIVFGEKVKVFHNFLPKGRSDKWYYKFRKNSTRNDLYIVILYYPFFLAIIYFWGKLFSHLKYSISNRSPFMAGIASIIGVMEIVPRLPLLLKKRNPLSTSQFKMWLKLRW